MKRARPYDQQIGTPDSIDLGKISTPQEISKRKILKVGRKKTTPSDFPPATPSFTLASPLQQKEEPQKTSQTNLFTNNQTNPANSLQESNALLSNFLSKGQPTKLFSNPIVCSAPPILPVQKPVQDQSKLGDIPGEGGTSNQPKEQKKGLFAGLLSGGNYIGNIFQTNSGKGFLSSKEGGFGLFSNSVQKAKSEQSDDGEGEENQLQHQSSDQGDPSKAQANFQYQSVSDRIFSAPAAKFKKNVNDVIEKIVVSVEKLKANGAVVVIVRTAATKVTIYTGSILKGLSEVKSFGSKAENISIFTASKQKEKAQRDQLKIQFNSEEDGKKFLEVVKGLIQ